MNVTPLPPPIVNARRKPKIAIRIVVAAIVVALVASLAIRVWIPNIRTRNLARISNADPKIQAAAKRAQAEIDSFIAELSHPRAGERFAIDGAFQTPQGAEYLWVKEPTYRSGVFEGTLDQPPVAFTGAARGDRVKVTKANVYDWKIKDGDEIRGGYVEHALQNR